MDTVRPSWNVFEKFSTWDAGAAETVAAFFSFRACRTLKTKKKVGFYVQNLTKRYFKNNNPWSSIGTLTTATNRSIKIIYSSTALQIRDKMFFT